MPMNKTNPMGNVKLFGDYITKMFTSNPLKYSMLLFITFFFSLIIHFMPGGEEYQWTDADGNKHTELSTKTSSVKTLKNQGSYYASITLFIILSCFYVFKFVSKEYKRIVFIASGIITSLVILYYIIKKSGLYNYNYEYPKSSVFILLSLIPVVLFYRSIKRHITNMEGWPGFIFNFILYIPCLVDDFMEYMKGQFAITSNITYILLGIETLLIAGYIILPSILSSPLKGSAFPIMDEANFLDSRKGYGVERHIDFNVRKDVYDYSDDWEGMHVFDPGLDKKKAFESGKNIFTLSMWVYLNQQDTNIITDDTNVEFFSYGQTSTSHPRIYYAGVDNGKNTLKMQCYTSCSPFEINIESQKWNNIVFNYNGNTVDIFLNGDLVKTHTVIDGLDIKYTDGFTYGSNVELDGAICNIKYYKKLLTKYQIVNIYNLLNGQNPPINNIM